MVGGKRKVSFADASGYSSVAPSVKTAPQLIRDDHFNIHYTRKRPTYSEATSGSARKQWKPQQGHGLYTNLDTGTMILNVIYDFLFYLCV